MKKTNLVLLLLILTLSLFSAPLTLLAEQGDVAATVNGVAISREDFYKVLEAQYGQQTLQEMIQDELIRQRAEALGVAIDDDEFAEMYELIIEQLGGPQGLEMLLAQNNATEDVFVQQLKWNMLLGDMARAEVEVEEGAVEAFFEEYRSYYDEPETVEVSHVLVETEEEAKELLAQLQAGADLSSIAMEHSKDPGTAAQGGYLGAVPRGYTVIEFEEMAFSLGVGEYGMTESSYGWHIITVHSKNEGKEAVFEEIAAEVERDYRGTRALDLQSYLYKLEQEADITVEWTAK